MTQSDLLTIITIIIAFLAFYSQEDREYIQNKFSKANYRLLIILFFFLNYLIYYPSLKERFEILGHFEFNQFPSSKTYAYIISLCTLFWLMFKIFRAKFPHSNQKNLIRYYQKLMSTQQYVRLLYLIEKYNFIDLENYFTHKKNALNKFLIETILINKQFITLTAPLNLDLYDYLLDQKRCNKEVYNAYVNTMINMEESHINYILNRSENMIPSTILNKIITQPEKLASTQYHTSLSISNQSLTWNKLKINLLLEINSYNKMININFREEAKSILIKSLEDTPFPLLSKHIKWCTNVVKNNPTNSIYFSQILSNILLVLELALDIKGLNEKITITILESLMEFDKSPSLIKLRDDYLISGHIKSQPQIASQLYRSFQKNFPEYDGSLKLSIKQISNY